MMAAGWIELDSLRPGTRLPVVPHKHRDLNLMIMESSRVLVEYLTLEIGRAGQVSTGTQGLDEA